MIRIKFGKDKLIILTELLKFLLLKKTFFINLFIFNTSEEENYD